jgi:hypothetical protein
MLAGIELPFEKGTGAGNIDDVFFRRHLDVVEVTALDPGVERPRAPFHEAYGATQKIALAPFLRKPVDLVE